MITLHQFAAIVVVSCSQLGGCNATANTNYACAKEANEKSESIEAVDLEDLAPGLINSMDAMGYWYSIKSIPTQCEAPPEFPDQRMLHVDQQGAFKPKSVAFVQLADISGVMFVYLTLGTDEMTEGVAAAIVEYDASGQPTDVHQLAEFQSFEGHGTIYGSRVSGQSVERCRQEIEYFEYADNGDIVGEFSVPRWSPKRCGRQIATPGIKARDSLMN